MPSSTQEQPKHTDEELKRRLLRALGRANRRYDVLLRAPHFFHLKSGHTAINVLLGCCGQCFKFDVDFRQPHVIRIRSTAPCDGWWGGILGHGIEMDERRSIQRLLTQEFSEYQVLMA